MKIWCLDYRDRHYIDAGMKDVRQFRGIKLLNGQTAAGSFPKDAIVEIRSRRAPTDFFKAGVFQLISSKLKTILDAFHVEAEYLPVRINYRSGELNDSWSCFNPLFLSEWFDRSRSTFVAEGDFATNIEKVVVRDDIFGDAPLAVTTRTIPRLVGVSDELAAAIVENKCTGVWFCDADAWRNPFNPVSRIHER